MADVSSILQDAVSDGQVQAGAAVPVPQQKMAEVAAATDAKKVDMGGIPSQDTFHNAAIMRLTGVGSDSATPLENDIAFHPDQLAAKYGESRASDFEQATAAASSLFSGQRNAIRSPAQIAGDAARGILTGPFTTAAQMAAGGLGLLSPIVGAKPGVIASQASRSLSDAVHSGESGGINAVRDANSQLTALQDRDEDHLYQSDKDSGAMVPWLQHMGREALTHAGNTLTNPTLLGDQAAEGLGSLVAMGPVSEVFGTAAKAILPQATRNSLRATAALEKATGWASPAQDAIAIGDKLPNSMMATGGAIGASGAYTGATNEAYDRLIQQGVDPDQAASQANKAGLIAGAVAGPLATVTSQLSEGFMEHPFVTDGIGHTAANLIRQGVEQGAQGAETQFGQNVGIKDQVDPNQDLTQGVGAAFGEGAVGGVSAAGLTQAPGLVAHVPTAVGKAVLDRGQAKLDANAKAAPNTDENVSKAAATFDQTAAAPETQAAFADATSLAKAHDEAQAQPGEADAPAPTGSSSSADAIEALSKRMNAYQQFDPAEIIKNQNLSDDVKQAVSDAPNRTIATLRLAKEVAKKGVDSAEGLAAASEMSRQIDGLGHIIGSDKAAFAAMPDDHPAMEVVHQFDDLSNRLRKNPTVVDAWSKVQNLSDEQVAKLIHPVTAETVGTEQGQQNVDNALMLAQHAPEKLPLEAATQISQMVENGKLKLSQDQLAALKTASAVVQSARQASEDRAKLGLTASDHVSDQILTNPEKDVQGKSSGAYYANGVYKGMKAGNVGYAQAHMEDLGHLVQHMQNKLAAINTHYTNGDGTAPIPFKAWNSQEKKEYTTPKDARVGVTTKGDKAENSVINAQRVAGDTRQITDLYNHLSKAFPELKAGSYDHTELHPNLSNKADKIVAAHARGDLVRPTFDRSSVVREAKPAETFKAHQDTPVEATEKAQEAPQAKEVPVEPIKAEEPQAAKSDDHEARQTLIDHYGFDPVTIRPGEAEHDLHFMETATKLSPDELKAKFDEANKAWKKSRSSKDEDTRDLLEAAILHQDHLATKAKAEATPDQTSSPQAKEVLAKGAEESNKTEAPPVDQPTATPPAADTGASEKKVEEQPAPKTTKEAFPNLVHAEDGAKGKNWFHAAYKLMDGASRIFGNDKPGKTLVDAFASNDTLENFLGKQRRAPLEDDIADEYRGFLGKVMPALRKTMDARLADRLVKTPENGKTAGKTAAQSLEDGVANEWKDAKALNLVEKQKDGSYKYNNALVNGAILAGLQWMMHYSDFARTPDPKAIEQMTGIPVDAQREGIEKRFYGIGDDEAVRSLADKIVQYWGVKKNSDTYKEFTDGIAYSMAQEVLSALHDTPILGDTPLFRRQTLAFTEKDGVVPKKGEQAYREVTRIVRNLKARDEDGQIQRLFTEPRLIDETVLTNPPNRDYYGDEKLPKPKTQLHNPLVPLTKPQEVMIDKAQADIYNLNPRIHSLYKAVSLDGLKTLFGGGKIDKSTTNEQDALSREGQNQTVESAWTALETRVGQMERMGDNPHIIPIRYAFEVSNAGRLMMQGAQNPQLSKLTREAILPTWSNVDLSKPGQHMDLFKAAIAQALGVKLIKLGNLDAIGEKVDSLLHPETGHYAKVVELLQDHLNDDKLSGSFINEVQKAFKAAGDEKITPVALHALQEYARYLNSDEQGRKEFRTGLYIEADGISNGVINAMHLFTSGQFTESQIHIMGKGGWLPAGEGQPKNMNEHRTQKDDKDTYTAGSDNLKTIVSNKFMALKEDAPNSHVLKQMSNLFSVMSTLLGKDFKFSDQTGEIEPDRGVIKNPMMITFYGSEAKGIANNITDSILDKLYQRMTQVAKDPNKDINQLFEGNTELTKAFLDQLHDLMTYHADPELGDAFRTEAEGLPKDRQKIDPVKFSVDGKEYETLRNNVRSLLVDHMREAITQTLGESVMQSKDILKAVTQAQSTALEHLYTSRVNALKKENGGYFPSEKQLQGVIKELHKIVPMIDTIDQRFYPVKNQASIDNDAVSRSLTGKFEINAEYRGPSAVGVGALPMLTQGLGDARMMQNAIINGVKGLPTYDGHHSSLTDILDNSRKLNLAVDVSQRSNALRGVKDSFSTFMDHVRNGLFEKEPKLAQQLMKSIVPWSERKNMTLSKFKDFLTDYETQLGAMSKSVDDRHAATDKFHYRVDHMASIGSAYEHKGLSLPKDNGAIAAELNKQLPGKPSAVKAKEEMKPTADTSNRIEISPARLERAIGELGVTPEHRDLWNRILNSNVLDNYRVVSGSLGEIEAYRAKLGLAMPESATELTKGFIDYKNGIIHLVSPKAETLLHEAIHAATFKQVLAHYEDEGKGLEPHVHDAVNRLEALKNDFLNLDPTDVPDSYFHASDAIRAAEKLGTPEGKAQAVNEFMAWTLANKDLTTLTKGKTASPLARVAQGVWEAIKKLVFGRYAPKVGDDIYSNLMFNTSLLVEQQPKVGAVNREITSFQHAAYGQNDRISDILGKFDMALGRFIKPGDPRAEIRNNSAIEKPLDHSADLAAMAQAHGFQFTPQESSAFRKMVQVTSLNLKLNSASLSRMDEIYRHVINTLTPQMLEDPNEPNREWAKHVAEEKHTMILGGSGMKFDNEGRSSLLPVFMGLSLIDENLRRALRELPLPKGTRKSEGTLDSILENGAGKAMDMLASSLSKEGNARNTGDAIDSLTRAVADSAMDTANLKDLVTGATTTAMNAVNDKVVNLKDKAADAMIAHSKEVQANPNSSNAAKITNKFGEAFAKFVSTKYVDEVGETILNGVNNLKGYQYFKDMVGDIVGRTSTNGSVFDLVKMAHTMVSKVRQEFRDSLPKTIEKQFSRKLEPSEKTAMHAMAKADVAVLHTKYTNDQVLDFVNKRASRDKEISKLEGVLQTEDPKHFETVKLKAEQLANHMNTGEYGTNLLRNADAVAELLNERKAANRVSPSADYRSAVDRLTTFYALNKLDPGVQKSLSSLVQSEPKGMSYITSYLNGLRKTEVEKSDGMAKYNALKGYVPSEQLPTDGTELRVAHEREAPDLLARSFTKVGAYKGSRLDAGSNGLSYWLSPVSTRAPFNQGIVQNVVHTAGGVDRATGFTDRGITAGRITNSGEVATILKRLSQEGSTKENLQPIYNDNGKIVAFERMVDPDRLRMLNRSTDLPKMLGVWAGRQVEEDMSHKFNVGVIDKLKVMYTGDSNKGAYVNLWDPKVQDSDPVMKDAVRLFNRETRSYINQTFDGKFMVRADMLRDLGYRSASIGDAWSGITRWKPETQQQVQKLAMGFLGNDAYRTLVKAEQNWQSIMKDAKSFIIVRSMIVPASNFVSNMYQLLMRGVTPADIVRGMSKKISEAHAYTQGRAREMEAQGELMVAQGAHDLPAQTRLKSEIQSIHDSWKSLSIWPMIKAGEFGAISNAEVTHEDLLLTGGKIDQFIAKQVDKLPKSAQTAARYALVTPDTALYQGLSKAIGYGDFLAKAIYYDHLIQRKGLNPERAMEKTSEEYVNFDRLPGRDRGYLDSMGMQWFFNHKLRSAKIALSLVRDNPVQALLSAQLGHFQPDTPIQANFLGKLWEGKMGYAIGPGMVLQSPHLNPWLQIYGAL